MLVSVIVPTFSRHELHEALHMRFEAQTYPNLELLVFDDSPDPSPYFRHVRSERVRYAHTPSRVSLGSKRNQLVDAARGEVIVQFDDDDLYAPSYIETMLAHLGSEDLIKLDGWYLQREADRSLWYWDTAHLVEPHFIVSGKPEKPIGTYDIGAALKDDKERHEFVAQNRWGYGFSYAYRRDWARRARFPDVYNCEDIVFVNNMRSLGAKLRAVSDPDGIVVHVLHPRSTSQCYPQYRVPSALGSKISAIGRAP